MPLVRAKILAVLLLLAIPLRAGERPVPGPETLLGDLSLGPITEPWGSSAILMATDGDEVLLVWIGRWSLYGQRLDREGRAVTAFPSLLVRGNSFSPVSGVQVVFTNGMYTLFHNRLEGSKWATWATRVTRELEVVDERKIFAEGMNRVGQRGDELVVLTTSAVVRLDDSLEVLETQKRLETYEIVPSPRGTLLIAATAPAITARMLDDSIAVRIASADAVRDLRALWTGTEYVLAWSDCHGSCRTRLLVLDERLAAKSSIVDLDQGGCSTCRIGLAQTAEDDVIVTWQRGDNTRAQRVLRGSPAYATPAYLGDFMTAFYSAHGLLLTVDRKLNVRAFAPGQVSAPSALPVVATPRAANEESILAVATGRDEVAVARHRNDGSNAVSILDRDGRTLREIDLGFGDRVTLAHDGNDFYALVTGFGGASFQKVAAGASPVILPFAPDPALVWAESGFYILQSNFTDFTGRPQYRTRFLWLTKEGKVEPPPCENWDFPSSASYPPVVIDTGEETVIAFGRHLARIRGKCPTGPPVPAPDLPYSWRAAWQNGTFAWVLTGGYKVDLALTGDPAAAPSLHRSDASATVYESNHDVSVIDGRWLVAYVDRDTLRTAVHDAHGALIGTAVVAEAVNGRPFLAPLGDRVLAIYRRQVYEGPYLGVHRVFATPLNLETSRRRRVVAR